MSDSNTEIAARKSTRHASMLICPMNSHKNKVAVFGLGETVQHVKDKRYGYLHDVAPIQFTERGDSALRLSCSRILPAGTPATRLQLTV